MEFVCCFTHLKIFQKRGKSAFGNVSESIPIHVTVVGDSKCGKTNLVYRLSHDRLPTPEEMATSSLDTDQLDVTHGKYQIKLSIHDTSGDEDYARIRALCYEKSDVILICFALDETDSLSLVISEWAPEVKYLAKGKPFLLVGTKCDLRDEGHSLKNQTEIKKVTQRCDKKTVKKIGAAGYLEFSAVSQDSHKLARRVFGEAFREALKRI